MNIFIGVDLGWYGKPCGLASLVLDGSALHLRNIARLESVDEILDWIQTEAGEGSAVAAVDAPLVIRNQTSIRPAERELNSDFRRFDAGCHAANPGRLFAQKVISFSRAATVNLFGLDQIVKHKRGTREQRAKELHRLRRLAMSHLPALDPSLAARLPPVPRTGSLKPTEDKIDAVLCGYIAAHWWVWGRQRNRLYGDQDNGYIVVPQRAAKNVALA